MPQETQQKTYKIVQSLKGKLTLGPLQENLQQLINGRRHFQSVVVLVSNTYGS